MNPTFQVQIPAKVILFGEWAVLDKKPAIGVALNKYFSLRATPHSEESGLRLCTAEASVLWTREQAQVPAFLQRAQRILQFLSANPLQEFAGYELKFKREWPLEEGLGSSSALFLCLLKFVESTRATPPSTALPARQKLLDFQRSGSGFDLLLQFLQSTAYFCEEESLFQALSLKIPPEVVFVHTGQKMKTEAALAQNRSRSVLTGVLEKSVRNFMRTQDWVSAIDEHHQALGDFGVVPDFVESARTELLQRGLIRALKTTGAGGGDTLLLWSPVERHSALNEWCEARGFWRESARPLPLPN